jgi:hypothetical protein
MSFMVLNLTTGRKMKRSEAAGFVEQCASVWVEEGYTIRDLPLPEMVAARSEQEPVYFADAKSVRAIQGGLCSPR